LIIIAFIGSEKELNKESKELNKEPVKREKEVNCITFIGDIRI